VNDLLEVALRVLEERDASDDAKALAKHVIRTQARPAAEPARRIHIQKSAANTCAEVDTLRAQGLTYTKIAEKLGISYYTAQRAGSRTHAYKHIPKPALEVAS
jgi:DNA invertase Pin-like site-specific DNA recombinase